MGITAKPMAGGLERRSSLLRVTKILIGKLRVLRGSGHSYADENTGIGRATVL